jgi:hypothetical protein
MGIYTFSGTSGTTELVIVLMVPAASAFVLFAHVGCPFVHCLQKLIAMRVSDATTYAQTSRHAAVTLPSRAGLLGSQGTMADTIAGTS